MKIVKEIMERSNVFAGEEITENIDILYEFLSEEYYDLIRMKKINTMHSSTDLVKYIEPIIEKPISHLDLKYCMELLGVKSESAFSRNTDGTYSKDGVCYYAIREEWCQKAKYRRIKKNHK